MTHDPSLSTHRAHPMRLISLLLSLTLGVFSMNATAQAAPKVKLETSLGNIVLQLDAQKAPLTTANFLEYVKAGHYDGLVFHRVIPNFMIQGGGYDEKMKERSTRAPIKNEASNGLKNVRGSVAMARTSNPNSATSQFFINHGDNDFLDYPGQDGYGYAVFGMVVEGLDVMDKIAATPTGNAPPFGRDVPVTPVVIKKATLVE
jgi:cyclophilin family peptidyl-prolyl cis-trans isomerase